MHIHTLSHRPSIASASLQLFSIARMYRSGILILLFLNFVAAEVIAGNGYCYILDGILVVYGVVLTILYCRLRLLSQNNETNEGKPEGIYQGLKHQNQDTYETLHVKKKPLA
ncbi:Fc receptor, IgE, high affinity I, gamma polypeptide like isoform X1 [Neoarius graeffei]|uniref:Fc receptor, IgE, high affinity I, gamma polypeptide like isoform X1 n=1 Tax=Neoarius graeffei TaxID=443677 RepID=UPI00298C4E7D|nr:Fc receptor, IgE, high affinity I, gamma polypeptide like isoform X1 [Neoarius graeffei]